MFERFKGFKRFKRFEGFKRFKGFMAAPAIARPMLASLADASLDDPAFVYEPKYDGIRAVAEIAAHGGPVRLWSRLGNDKAREFQGVVAALRKWAARRRAPLILDGEIVALDAKGHPAGFQHLQRRTDDACAFIGFDVVRDGATDLRGRPLVERRKALERIFARTGSPILRLSEMVHGDGRALYARALASGWEGLIAKRAASLYLSGKRTPDWRKVKILHVQEFVVGGWTEPRQTRSHFGALILGVYDHGDLVYAGHVGTGFDERELARLFALLKPIEVRKSPFRTPPPSNETPHWVRPALVAEVKFTEWTADGSLRHPVYLGLRDDKEPKDVRREDSRVLGSRVPGSKVPGSKVPGSRVHGSGTRNREPGTGNPGTGNLLDQLRTLEDARRDGVVTLDGGASLKVTNLHKVFWPKQKLTKGDLMRYYVDVAPFVLPAVADRPLVMKRYPNGIAGAPFYQHRATDAPPGVRVETVRVSDHEARPQIIGGDLTTLLYMTQLAAISQDPWFSRVASPDEADYVALDLDPMPDVPFAHVLDVARWIRDELASLGASGVPKTSGADGLHVYVALPRGTPYDVGLLFCQIVATVVSQKHPKLATVERSLKARGRRVYVDYLQNILGKTLATAYSARASEYSGVSTPLTWDEVDAGVDREAFTIATVPARLRAIGDLWAPLRTSKGVDLSRATRYGKRR
jgi:bifunctional non-homologous end joining protein LigD